MRNEYYSLKKINKLNALYNLIIGQRSNGKTYAVCEQEVKGNFKEGYRMAYIRRYDEEIMPKNIQNLFKPHSALIENYPMDSLTALYTRIENFSYIIQIRKKKVNKVFASVFL